MATVKKYVGFRQVSQNGDPYITALIVDGQNIREAFRPIGVAESLNQSSAPVHEGMRITFHFLKEMDRVCRQEGCRLLVVITPTKEGVFSDYIEKNPRLHLHEVLIRVIENERLAKKAIVEFLNRTGIEYIDPLPVLKQSVGEGIYAQTTRDFHPNNKGYKIIGESIAEYFNRSTLGG